jgi:hypothetical protein
MTKYYRTYESLQYLPNQFYLFSYGANNIDQLTKTLSFEKNLKEEITRSADALDVYCYRREFFGDSPRWEGSVATIVHAEIDKCVSGLILLITKKGNDYFVSEERINFLNILKREEFQKVYIIEQICDHTYPVVSFVMNPNYKIKKTKEASEKYLKAIWKTLKDYRKYKSSKNNEYLMKVKYLNNALPEKIYKMLDT